MEKFNIIFVGSFKNKSIDNILGGQMFASETLINSELKNSYNWFLINSTASSNKDYIFLDRLFFATKRLLKLLFYLTFKKINYILIFTGEGNGFFEKSIMTLISKYIFNIKVILAPRSGLIKDNLESSVFFKYLTKLVFNSTYKIICQSQIWKEFFSNYVNDKEKLFIIENSIDFTNYSTIKLSQNTNNVSILFLAWVDYNKGIFELVDACYLLKKNNISFKLQIAGDGRDFEKIRDKIKILNLSDCVFMLGWVSQTVKLKLLESSDIFILPTHFEGYPNSLMEAMLAGKACIATKIGSIPDIIKHKENGLLINMNKPQEIYDSIKLLINNQDLRTSISLSARNTIISHNSTDIMIEKYSKILKQL